MSEHEGQPVRDMNPFSNNRPRLTASERIKNKRDATIYKAEKLRFQNSKKKCGNQNVRFYKNGKIKSMKSYKLQKSLARGNILCNDCDDKGNLCAPPSEKDDLATIYMGNNAYSEYWGGAGLEWDKTKFLQTDSKTVINSDISGVWGGSITDISKSLIGPDASSNGIPMPYGYINNLITIPRDFFDGDIVIDPSNILFPDELCDPFRYLQSSYLKTFVVLTMAVPVIAGFAATAATTCDNSLNQILVNSFITMQSVVGGSASWFASGEVRSLCCVGTFNLLDDYLGPPFVPAGTFGLFDVYINLFNIKKWSSFNTMLNDTYELAGDGTSNWKNISSWCTIFKQGDFESTLPFTFVRKTRIIQGSIPPSQNQTKYNSTLQSYMSCLENGTKNIKFTKQNTRIPVKNAFCTPLPPCVSVVTFTINLTSGPSLPSFVSLSDGKYLLFDIGSNTDATWTFDVINITDSCNGKLTKMKVDYLVVGGGGSGGSYVRNLGSPNPAPGWFTTGGGGGGEVRTGSFDISGNSSFEIEVGRGDDPLGALAAGGLNWDASYNKRFNSLNSLYAANCSLLKVTDIASSAIITNQVASFGQHGANTTYRNSDPSNVKYLQATDGGASGSQSQSNGGSVLNPDPSGTNYYPGDPPGNPSGTIAFNGYAEGYINNMTGSAGGGSNAIDGGDSGGTDCSGNNYNTPDRDFLCSGGNGANGVVSSITGTTQYYGAGGGGSVVDGFGYNLSRGNGGLGNLASGGNGAYILSTAPSPPQSAIGNDGNGYGAGGGGSIFSGGPPASTITGGAGYRGVVILKFYNAPV